MKKLLRRASVFCLCIILLTVNFLTPVGVAASNIYELTFDNIFVFEKWANAANSGIVTPGTPGQLTKDIGAGTFNLVNTSAENIETYTAYGNSINGYYYMSVEENTQYTFAFSVEWMEGATQNFESFVFFYDSNGNLTEWVSYNPLHYGLSEWNFTTPAGTKYIQVRFDNNWASSQAKISDIRICESEIYEVSKEGELRKTYEYTEGAVYGELPAPERQGLVFAGWFTEPEGKGQQITAQTKITPNSYSLFSHFIPIPVQALELVAPPVKTTYTLGEALNTRGMVLRVIYPDGTSENIDEEFVCTPNVLTATGEQTVTVSYGSASVQLKVNVIASEEKTLTVNGSQKTVDCADFNYALNYSASAFNRFEIKYSSDAYVKGQLNFNGTIEEFFLEPSENGSFSSYIDGFLDGKTQTKITSISFEPLDKAFMDFSLNSLATSKQADSSDDYGMVYLSSADYKIGIDLDWGGSLTYLEDLKNNVVAAENNQNTSAPVEVGLSSDFEGTYKVNCSDEADIYEKTGSVNLINAHDTGRLVQQSYYGAGDSTYEPGMFEQAAWPYNPVQGGNQYNDASKIVDLKVTENEIYIKCRPLDWAREAKYITPTYMEAWYTLEDGVMRATCRFVDYSGYPSLVTDQEVPAFYCVEPLNNLVFYEGGDPWSDNNKKVTKDNLQFWSGRDDQNFNCNENWAAFVGDGESGYGIGLYCPGQTNFRTGVMERDTLTTLDTSGQDAELLPNQPAANHNSTSYIGVIDSLCFESYSPISYCYYITTGNVDTIRNNFKPLAQQKTDICNATHTNGFCDMCAKQIEPELNEDNAYEISSIGELYWFSDYVNSGNVNANAVLTCDITDNEGVLSSYGVLASDTSAFRSWTPIGTQANKYNGHFDGQGYTINGLYIYDSGLSYGGLFGYTSSSAVIEEVGIDDSYFYGNQYMGSICGYNGGEINNCYSFYTVTRGSTYVGGITGYNNKTVKNCYSAGIVQGTTYAGGIAGYKSNNAGFSNCYCLFSASSDGNGVIQNGIGSSSKGSTTADISGATQVKTAQQFASGEVAYLLQEANSQQLWGQKTNILGMAPVFDKSGKYEVHPIVNENGYSLVDIGDVDDNESVNVSDYQQLVNVSLSDEELEYKDMLRSDIDGDGRIDVMDCAAMHLLISGLQSGSEVYLKGDFDRDGTPFTTTDVQAIKKALINQEVLDTRQKYACDLNFDGVLDVNDKDFLIQ